MVPFVDGWIAGAAAAAVNFIFAVVMVFGEERKNTLGSRTSDINRPIGWGGGAERMNEQVP